MNRVRPGKRENANKYGREEVPGNDCEAAQLESQVWTPRHDPLLEWSDQSGGLPARAEKRHLYARTPQDPQTPARVSRIGIARCDDDAADARVQDGVRTRGCAAGCAAA